MSLASFWGFSVRSRKTVDDRKTFESRVSVAVDAFLSRFDVESKHQSSKV